MLSIHLVVLCIRFVIVNPSRSVLRIRTFTLCARVRVFYPAARMRTAGLSNRFCHVHVQWTMKYLLNSRFIPLAASLRDSLLDNHTRGALQCPKLSSRLFAWHKSRLNVNVFHSAPVNYVSTLNLNTCARMCNIIHVGLYSTIIGFSCSQGNSLKARELQEAL